MTINSHNEWDKLKEVIVGNGESQAALIFPKDRKYSEDEMKNIIGLAKEAYPQKLTDEINEDLEELCNVLREFGCKVLRPNNEDINKMFSTPNFTAIGNNLFNMRDLHLVVGNTVIESPSPSMHRYFEPTGLNDIWYDYFKSGFRWIGAPKSRLVGNYRIPFFEGGKRYSRLTEDEILFDAAAVLRMGRDLIYLVSSTGNYLGAKWLSSILGEEYRVHTTEGIYRSSHIDSTALALKPGLILLNEYRVNEKNCPPVLKQWDKIYFNDIAPFPSETLEFQEKVRSKIAKELKNRYGVDTNIWDTSSEWMGMNIFSLDTETVIADKRQTSLIRVLEKHKLTVIPVSVRHSYLMGGLHCNMLDTVRESKLESYFD